MKIVKLIFAGCFAAAMSMAVVSCGNKSTDNSAEGDANADLETVTETEAATATDGAVIVLQKGAEIAPADGKLVVIDFNATWCGPCKQFAPNFEAVAEKNADNAVFYSVDVDEHPELAAQYGVESIPMVVYINADGTTDSTVGYMDEAQFSEAVANHLK